MNYTAEVTHKYARRAPGSNSERDYTLEKETYRWRTKQDEYGNQLICLANDKGETCYRRHKE